MAWIFAAVVLFLLVMSRGFRLFCLWGSLILIVLGGIGWGGYSLYEWYVESRARSLVSVEQIAIDDLMLAPPVSGYGSYRISGRLKNGSAKHTVTQFTIRVRLKDCQNPTLDDDANCIVVGEKPSTVYLEVPPGQVRNFDQTFVVYPNPVFRGQSAWTVKIVEILAE